MVLPSPLRQRSDLTFKANQGLGRHGWLRLTPAYSVWLVRERLATLPRDAVIFDPFSGSGTTVLAAQELGLRAIGQEINPFLVWLGRAKLDIYSAQMAQSFATALQEVAERSLAQIGHRTSSMLIKNLWIPPIFQIEKWWDEGTLAALASLRTIIDQYRGKVRNLLDVTFCRVMIATSNAAFNHQSMSFKKMPQTLGKVSCQQKFKLVMAQFKSWGEEIRASLQTPSHKTAILLAGDSTQDFRKIPPVDLVLTSPPYANRMSYIRELRPYMYWLRFINSGAAAGNLDWQTIGGTWGLASTKIKAWPLKQDLPISKELDALTAKIYAGPSGKILAPYVAKYFFDIWQHLQKVVPLLKNGGKVCYIVGNSTFGGQEVPTHRWYAQFLRALGLKKAQSTIIRKRNSNKRLFEYAVTAQRDWLN